MQRHKIKGFERISKTQAFKRFVAGQSIVLCPVKFAPGGPFCSHSVIYGDEIEERLDAQRFKIPLPINPAPLQMRLWADEAAPVAWESLLREWSFYNTSYEQGYYPAFYVHPDYC